jgi:DNA polymerase-4
MKNITSPQLPTNKSLPYIMHIDLNSCFAIIEQQANRLLRGRPVGIAAYDTPRGFLIASSYQAKAKGVKLGVNVGQARAMCPGIVIMTPDPAKYREAHKLFKELLLEYTPDVVPKSIDEFVLNMNASPALQSKILSGLSHNEAMLEIGNSMKQKIRERLGEYVTVNVGISTNRFLAKYAAGFGKPDGMTLIDHSNLRSMYDGMKLVDLPGINTRFRARLRIAGIYTPLDFLRADMNVLKKQVFKSINGYHWYRRLRGYEADAVEFSRKSIGHQYALPKKTTDIEDLERLLMKLCEKTGRRLRKNNLYALGIHLYLGFQSDYPTMDGPSSFENMHNIRSWHHGEKTIHRLYSTSDIYEAGKRLLHSAEIPNNVKLMSVTVFGLHDWDPVQLSIFDISESETNGHKARIGLVDSDIRIMDVRKRTSDAVDAINNRYGEFVINPAAMMDMKGEILDRIAFGQVRDM